MYRLRELERRDIPKINGWRSDRELAACLGSPFRYIGPEVDFNWFENYLGSRDSTVRCALTREGSDEIIGLITLASIDRLDQSAVLHLMIGRKEDRGKGAGTFAVTEILKHAFFDMNLRRVELSVLAENTAARHLYEKCGFVQEGVKRSARFKNGRFSDLVIYAVLREEYEKAGIRRQMQDTKKA